MSAVALAPAGVTLAVFIAAIFLSAALLFAVQPMFAKIVLPYLGGAPAVWSVAMVFFQATLLAGYAYAHVLTLQFPGRQSVVIHLVVMVAATLLLPISIATGWGRPPDQWQELWLLGLFAVSIGLPFFALSANAPLLQAWFARTGHGSAKDPYFLYAASNAGSFLALISYPFLIEPLTMVRQQTRAWAVLFYLLIVLVAVCGVLLVRSRNASASSVRAGAGRAVPAWSDVFGWIALAAVPSGLMIAVTAHISTDIAAAPFLWVVPLALYLLSFVIVFSRKPILPHEWSVMAQPFFLAALIATFVVGGLQSIFLMVAIHLAAFFVTAMVCHGELARKRPPARYLTAFYLWLSVGGVAGGIFAGLIAPNVFNWVAEYPLLIVLAALCRPGLSLPDGREAQIFWFGTLALAVLLAAPRFLFGHTFDQTTLGGIALVLLAAAIMWSRDTLKFAALIALTLMFIRLYGEADGIDRISVRSFFGVNKIIDTADGRYRVLMHGTTIHGAQRIRDADGAPISGRPEPITYYSRNAGMDQAIKAVRERKGGGAVRVASIGLGTGTIACLTEPGDALDYYEIDRKVVRFTRDEQYFTFLAACAPDARVILGDARLTLQDAADGSYDIIIVDAFTSDAIPTHLLTREAMAVYLKKTEPNGLVLMHVSNRHLELASVVAGIADANGALTRVHSGEESDTEDDAYKFSATVAAVARSEGDFGPLAKSEHWPLQEPDPDQWVWTDDYSNVIGALIRQYRD